MSSILITIVAIPVLLWLIARFFLSGKSHAAFDAPAPQLTGKRTEPSTEHNGVVQFMQAAQANGPKLKRDEMLAAMRKQMNAMGENVPFEGEIKSVQIDGLDAEWVVAPGADPDQRLLYLHGGAFTMGSPLSHRAITTEYARRLGVAVLAIDYRLMPEHPRRAGIEDCQAAYRWILENGPDGPAAVKNLLVSGDSAGGNLTLMITAWARDEGLRAADAAIALSPATDSSFTSPTLKANLETDVMLGPLFGQALAKTPRWIMAWSSFISNRISPASPLVSPLQGDLSGLPPTLLHASTAEMLEGDAVRYYNKAVSQGSPVELGMWPFMLHVWHAFVLQMPEAREAFDHIEEFARRCVPSLNKVSPALEGEPV